MKLVGKKPEYNKNGNFYSLDKITVQTYRDGKIFDEKNNFTGKYYRFVNTPTKDGGLKVKIEESDSPF